MVLRSSLLGLVLGLGLFLLAGATPQSAFACCTPPPTTQPTCCQAPPTPPCCTATPPCCTPPPAPPPPPPPCCNTGHNINVPNINVNVASTVVVNASATANVNASASANGGAWTNAGANAGSGSTVYYGGGGGGGGYAPPMASGMIQGLNVEAGRKMRRTSYQATRSRTTRVVIQAVCMDDRAIPHPASQVTPDRDIDDAYDGELYRCIAGTFLSATIADYRGQVDFSGGRTLVCGKSDALYHLPGGRVECRPQRPARDCNERSLLRRFGAGIKILTMTITETYTAYRDEEDRSESSVSTAMSLDGGVGGISY